MTPDTNDLKPCPICSGKVRVKFMPEESFGEWDHYKIECYEPNNHTVQVIAMSEAECISLWNTRALQPPAIDVVACKQEVVNFLEPMPRLAEWKAEHAGTLYKFIDYLAPRLKSEWRTAEVSERWRGICKLVEEQGEVLQLVGKLMAYPTGEHPDGKGNLFERLHDELADLGAARDYFIAENGFDVEKIEKRKMAKFFQFKEWIMSGIRAASPEPKDGVGE